MAKVENRAADGFANVWQKWGDFAKHWQNFRKPRARRAMQTKESFPRRERAAESFGQDAQGEKQEGKKEEARSADSVQAPRWKRQKPRAKCAKSAKGGTLKTIESPFGGIEKYQPQRTQRNLTQRHSDTEFLGQDAREGKQEVKKEEARSADAARSAAGK